MLEVTEPTETETDTRPKVSKLRRRFEEGGKGPKPASIVEQSPTEFEVDMEPRTDGELAPPATGDKPVTAIRVGQSAAVKRLREEEDQDAATWLRSLSTEPAIRVAVMRREPEFVIDPKTGNRVQTRGNLRTYESTISPEEIAVKHGGGVYKITVTKRDDKGRYMYFGNKTIEVAGEPRIDDLPRNTAPTKEAPVTIQSTPDNAVTLKMMDMLGTRMNQPAPTPPDMTGQITLMMEPMRAQIALMQRQLELKDKQLEDVRNGPPGEATFQQKMMDKLLDGDTARLESVRLKFQSELDQAHKHGIENERRLREQFDRDKEQIYRAHEREIKTLTDAATSQRTSLTDLAASQKSALENVASVQKLVLEGENKRLMAQVAELKADVKELQVKKDKSIKDMLGEVKDLKELLDDGDDDEKKSGIQGVIEGIASSPMVGNLMQRLGAPADPAAAQAATTAAQQAQQQRARPRIIRDKRTGQTYDAATQRPVTRKQAALPPQQPGQEQAVPPPQPKAIPYIAPETVKMAIDFMLGAYQNGTDPVMFAQTWGAVVPKEVLTCLRELGIDEFLARVAQLDGGSPLRTQGGRNWARRATDALLGNTPT